MSKLTKNTFPFLGILGCYLIIFSVQTLAKPTNFDDANIKEIRFPIKKIKFAPVLLKTIPKNLIRKRRQLRIPRILPMRSRIRPLLPPRQPIILSMITSAVSDGIRTYPYYLQEIPLAFGETILNSVREAAPHITDAIKDISPGIMEIMNAVPETETMHPFQKIMKKIPTVIHETMQVALDPQEENEESELIPNLQRLVEEPTKITHSYSRPMEPLKMLQEKYQNTKDKLNYKFEKTKQKAQSFYQNLLQDYEEITPKRKIYQNEIPKTMKKASQTISPVINESLTEMAKLPQKIKKFVEQMKQ
ncbi:unnamed protein product [Danaus chrysippus]|uniref:(African queen) hypothetical protein n=1 Tax=Danaus chrysippus TaxID=151541 RepID=A0A8J2QDQ1_9NEOP|nr:unnamed protein product [Danaus chrysippus]